MEEFEKLLTKKYKDVLYKNKTFKDITTFKIGGGIKYLLCPKTIKEMIGIIKLCKKHNIKHAIIGGGSNVLAGDETYDGVVILTKNINNVKTKNKKVVAECGAYLGKLVLECKHSGLSNLEWAIGIPGTVGGATVMNAGAFENELFDFLEYTIVFDGKRIKKLFKKDIKHSYRTTEFQKSDMVILKAQFWCLQKKEDEIAKNIEFFVQKRAKMQKICEPNAGSVFKKPSKSISASLLLDMAGLKGKQFGGAIVSPVHAGFIVNANNATCKEVQKLIAFILDRVYNIFNIKLELEIVYIN